MKASKRAAAVLAISMLGLVSAACGDARELSATAIVLGIGIDESDEKIELTVELSSADSSEAIVLQARDDTLEACVKTIEQSNYEYLFWGGTAAIVFGGSLDEKTAGICALYLYRDLGVSGKTPVIEAWRCAAADILKGSFGQAPYIAVGLSEAMRIEGLSGSVRHLTLAKRLESYLGEVRQEQTALVTIDDDGNVRMVELPQ